MWLKTALPDGLRLTSLALSTPGLLARALFQRCCRWCQAGTHPRQFCLTASELGLLPRRCQRPGPGAPEAKLPGKYSQKSSAATTVFCNAGSISETPLLVPSWNSSAAILCDVLYQKRSDGFWEALCGAHPSCSHRRVAVSPPLNHPVQAF